MNIQSHYNLQSNNTLCVPSFAEWFCEVSTVEELQEAVEWSRQNTQPVHVIGEGSNLLLDQHIKGLIIRPNLNGISLIKRTATHAYVEAKAGENWHGLVKYCVDRGYYGIENLALIPGTVGAAPVQNIGAYGVELMDFFDSLEAYCMQTKKIVSMSKADCQFEYRDSVFKQNRGQYIILSVVLSLNLADDVNVEYPALNNELKSKKNISAQDVFEAVVSVRQEKLPDPRSIPNVGSFFKNPIVSKARFLSLKERYPDIPSYPVDEQSVKLPAAWLIDQAGWKGKESFGVGVHDRQALVLVNPNKKSIDSILSLAQAIQDDIKKKYGLTFDIEPQRLS